MRTKTIGDAPVARHEPLPGVPVPRGRRAPVALVSAAEVRRAEHPRKAAPIPRTRAGRSSWLRRTGRVCRNALAGALLVGTSLQLSACGGSDHSGIQVSQPPVTTIAGERGATTRPPEERRTPGPVEQLNALLEAGNIRLEYPRDFADPFVLRDGKATYFYATNAHFANVPVLDAQAMLEGAGPREAFPTENLGVWAQPNISHVWAPAVAKLADGRYALFYSAQEKSTGQMAVGVAYADSPLGPFADPSAAPLIRSPERGGVIDASTFQENGRTFVVYKNDGNSRGAETAIWIREFDENTGMLTGPETKLLGDAGHQAWEEAGYTSPHALIEGPKLVHAEGKYYLFYCANDWASQNYGINYAVSDSLTGPYTRAQGPWMQSEAGRFGPGGPEIFQSPDGDLLLAYHAWNTAQADPGAGDARRLVIEPLEIDRRGVPQRALP